MNLTQHIRIFPTPEQEEVLWKLSEKCRLIYNFALAERRHAYRHGIKGVNYRTQQNDLLRIKKKYPEYRWVYSKVLQYVLRSLAADYESFFALRKHGHADARPPRFKGKRYFTTMVYNQSGFKLEPGKISFSHNYNDIPLEFTIPEKFSFDDTQVKQVAISAQRNRYFVTISYQVEEPPYVDNGRYQAIDLGVPHIVTAVNSQGKFLVVNNQRPDKYWNPKIAKIQAR
ncbi:MAG: RNA-guided endonuclease InsQ/TnpB family protein [Promethearchaeota archaeon]